MTNHTAVACLRIQNDIYLERALQLFHLFWVGVTDPRKGKGPVPLGSVSETTLDIKRRPLPGQL